MTDPVSIDLTPVQVRRLEQASAAVARAYEVFAEPLRQTREAEDGLRAAYAAIIEAAGQSTDEGTWEIVEDGDAVRLVQRGGTS